MITNSTKLAYWAGVFDAGGCICMKTTPTLPAPYIALRSKTDRLPRQLRKDFGGGVRIEKQGASFLWSRSHVAARDIASALWPYMFTKIDPRIFGWVPGTRGRKRNPNARLIRLMEDK